MKNAIQKAIFYLYVNSIIILVWFQNAFLKEDRSNLTLGYDAFSFHDLTKGELNIEGLTVFEAILNKINLKVSFGIDKTRQIPRKFANLILLNLPKHIRLHKGVSRILDPPQKIQTLELHMFDVHTK